METNTIRIRIGRFEGDWQIIDTNAPQAYDGFGTFTIHEYEGTRTVLIRQEHFNWQTSRYSSGMHTWEPSLHDASTVEEALYRRLTQTESK